MERRRIARATQPDGAADEQREDADRGKEEVERARAARNRRNPHVDHFPGAEPQDGVARVWPASAPRSTSSMSETCCTGRSSIAISRSPRRIPPAAAAVPAAISAATTPCGCAVQRTPSSTACHVAPSRDVRDAEAQQRANDDHWEDGPSPWRPRA